MSRIIRISKPAWFVDAACRGEGPEAFFPAKGKPTNATRQRCAECPVVRQCHEYAMADVTLEGIWAGLSVEQRDQLRRRKPA